jgi:hypothetical protein
MDMYVSEGLEVEKDIIETYPDVIGDLLNRVDTLEQNSEIPKEDSVFIAQYGETTLAELHEAFNADKVLFCKDGGYITPMFRVLSSGVIFCRNDDNNLVTTYCNKNGWNKKTTTLCESKLGDIEAALDSILKIQNALIGGDVS